MKVWITNGRNFLTIAACFLCLVLCLAAPARAFAAVQFTEVLYDAPGADIGREWIEVTNMGSTSVDVTGYKLFEAGVNHALTVTQGTTTLLAGESAIVASDPQKFLTDYPAYSGTLFKSSFSLLNTTGSFALKDNTLAVIDSASYSSSMGAAGDGNSLHFINGTWVEGVPNPGSNAPTKPLIKAAPIVTTSVSSKQSSASANKINTTKKSSSTSGAEIAGKTVTNSATVAMAPVLQNIPSIYMYILGALALIILVAGAVLYTKPLIARASLETEDNSGEFELE